MAIAGANEETLKLCEDELCAGTSLIIGLPWPTGLTRSDIVSGNYFRTAEPGRWGPNLEAFSLQQKTLSFLPGNSPELLKMGALRQPAVCSTRVCETRASPSSMCTSWFAICQDVFSFSEPVSLPHSMTCSWHTRRVGPRLAPGSIFLCSEEGGQGLNSTDVDRPICMREMIGAIATRGKQRRHMHLGSGRSAIPARAAPPVQGAGKGVERFISTEE